MRNILFTRKLNSGVAPWGKYEIGSTEDQTLFFNRELKRIHDFFEFNLEAYKYYRLEETSHDEQYFLRDYIATDLPTEDASLLYDSRFSTEMGYKFARIKANEMLKSYLQAKLEEVTPPRGRLRDRLGKWRSQ